MKKSICLVTTWYPTKENPFQGVFFKEQALAMKDYFDFVVLHYSENDSKQIRKSYRVSTTNKEGNTIEYEVIVNVPLWVRIENLFYRFRTKNRKEETTKSVSPRRSNFTREMLTRIFNEHIDEKIDVFYCIDAQLEAFYLQCLAEYYGKPYIISEHAPFPWPGSQLSVINKEAIEKANLFFAISKDKIRQMLMQNLHLPETVYIGNLIDETKLTIEPRLHEIKTFVIVAANSFYKNYSLFIKVMDTLSLITDKPFRVMIVGYAANKGYSKKPEELEKMISESLFADKAELIPYVSHEAIGAILNRADAYVMTSIQEGQPVSALEAACCGLPIFSTRCGGVEDYVDDQMGRIYDVTDYEGMAEGLKDFLEGRVIFDANYIRERVVTLFGNRAFASNFCNAFDKVMENGNNS